MQEHNDDNISDHCSVEVVENGYVVKSEINYAIKTRVFKDFTDVVNYMASRFGVIGIGDKLSLNFHPDTEEPL